MSCKALLWAGALVALVGGVQAEEIGYIEEFGWLRIARKP